MLRDSKIAKYIETPAFSPTAPLYSLTECLGLPHAAAVWRSALRAVFNEKRQAGQSKTPTTRLSLSDLVMEPKRKKKQAVSGRKKRDHN